MLVGPNPKQSSTSVHKTVVLSNQNNNRGAQVSFQTEENFGQNLPQNTQNYQSKQLNWDLVQFLNIDGKSPQEMDQYFNKNNITDETLNAQLQIMKGMMIYASFDI